MSGSIREYIREHLEDGIEELQRLCRSRSVSAQGEGRETAELVVEEQQHGETLRRMSGAKPATPQGRITEREHWHRLGRGGALRAGGRELRAQRQREARVGGAAALGQEREGHHGLGHPNTYWRGRKYLSSAS
jgi:hypothetical protein